MKQGAIAKISRPNATGIIHRERLFRLLDAGRKQPIVWVTGPAGSGKTSLVASYLDARRLRCLWYQTDEGDADIASFFYYMGVAAKKAAPRTRKPLPLFTPEYLMGIAPFTKRYFENLFSILVRPSPKKAKRGKEQNAEYILVFDNYQDVPGGSGFHEMIRDAFSAIPDGIRIIAISRSEPPPALARIRTNGQMRLIGWDDVRFTAGETTALFRVGGRKSLPSRMVKRIHARTEGWVAGFMFLLEKLKTSDVVPEFPDQTRHEELFEYFAGEVFHLADAETRDFLLKTSLLPKIAVSAAGKLAHMSNAGVILGTLCRNHFFTARLAAKEAVYQYHSLFREFLLSRASTTFPPDEMKGLRKQAAGLLEQSGQIEDAAELYREAGAWASFACLITKQAQRLVMEGRYQTLEVWITSFPAEFLDRSPWLLFWLGTCRLPFNPKEALRHFEKAFTLFEQMEDASGTLLAWSGAVNAVLLGWDDFAPLDSLIAWLYERTGRFAFPSLEVEAECASSMAGAMVWRQPDHPDIEKWVERALDATGRSENPALKLQACIHASYYYLWVGDIANALLIDKEMREMTRQPAVSPLMLITCKWLDADTAYLASASYESGLQAVREGLETARVCGIHVWDHMMFALGAYGSLLKGDREASSEYLEKMKLTLSPDRSHGYCHYHYLAAWYSTQFDGLSAALSHAELALKHAVEIRGAGLYFPEILCRLALANILCKKKNHQEARGQLVLAHDLIGRSRSRIMDFMHRLTSARISLAEGNVSEGMNMLRSGFEMGRSHNFLNTLYWRQPTVMTELCARAIEAGIETEYVKRLIRTHNLTPGDEFLIGPEWPWPVRITTLGRFALIRDGVPVTFGRKVQHKPLMLLKALIACGGTEVPEEKISDLLWPESEGDAAHSAFSTTLHRLRALIGNDALVLRERRLSLDHRFCWVDAWAFERMHEGADALRRSIDDGGHSRQKGIATEAGRCSEKALELYRGQFLPGDAGQVWTAQYRERLRNKFYRLVLQYGAYLEKTGQWQQTAEIYERALENDELAEEFYQHLMLCFQKLGRKSDAIKIYSRCRAILSSVLGINPSAKTEAIYSSIRE